MFVGPAQQPSSSSPAPQLCCTPSRTAAGPTVGWRRTQPAWWSRHAQRATRAQQRAAHAGAAACLPAWLLSLGCFLCLSARQSVPARPAAWPAKQPPLPASLPWPTLAHHSAPPLACPQVRSNFAGHPLLAPRLLMAAARWNLCLQDNDRRQRGDPDLCWCAWLALCSTRQMLPDSSAWPPCTPSLLCHLPVCVLQSVSRKEICDTDYIAARIPPWTPSLPSRFEADQGFTEVAATRLEAVDVVDGSW